MKFMNPYAQNTEKILRRRKITDKSVPNALAQLPEFAEDSHMYQSLLEMEKRLDWTMNRKKVEVQDALARNPTVGFTCLQYTIGTNRLSDCAYTAAILEPYGLWAAVANWRSGCRGRKL